MRSEPGFVPERVGPYPVIRELGRGGMGVVYLARDPRLDRDVAIKVLSEAYVGDAELISRFEREAKALAALNHANIATIFGLEEAEDGSRFLVLEFIHGETLGRRLKRGPLPLRTALSICRQIAEGVEAAHEQGVIHRDLKPDNVMLAAGDRVKLMDFGLAKRMAPGPTGAATDVATAVTSYVTTEPGRVMGTPGYISPEQIRGESLDKRTDIFSFGCVLFECLAGRRPFGGGTAVDMFAAILTRDPEWALLPPDVPVPVENLLARCLEKDVGQRCREMRQVRLEIEGVLEGARAPSSVSHVRMRARVPNNLPAEISSFVGRESEIEALREILEDTRLLTLTGVGGCGKTRLSLKLAGRVMARFPDGVWFVELAPLRDAGRVAHAVASVLGLKEEPGQSLSETLATHFRDQTALLLLDNCEHVVDACSDLAALLVEDCPGLTILATSREALVVPGEQTFLVPPLSVPAANQMNDLAVVREFESVRLFEERAKLTAPGFALTAQTGPVVADICMHLDGIPLALELAAARVKILSVDQVREKLKDRFRLLTGGSKKALAHHQTLRAAIDWSYEQLSELEQKLLGGFSVFAGGWTLDAANVVGPEELDEFEILDVLTQLVDRSLVVALKQKDESVRFRLLETIRQYGREKLEETGESNTVLARHLDFFLALAEEAEEKLSGPEQVSWQNKLEVEHDNLLAALDACASVENGAKKGLRLAGALWRFWYLRGYYGYGWNALTGALGLEGAAEPSEERAKALHGAGSLALVHADYAAAHALYEEGLDIRRTLGDRPGIARLLNNLGTVAWYQGDFARARSLYGESLDIKRELGDERGIAATLDNLGSVLLNLNDRDSARSLHEESLELHRRLGNRSALALSLHNLGIVSRYLGDYRRARELHEESLEIERELGNKLSTMPPLFNLAAVATKSGDFAGAQPYLVAAFELVQETGEKRFGAYSLEAAGELASALGDREQASRLYGAAEAIREEIGSPLSPAEKHEYDAVVTKVRGGDGDETEGPWNEGRETPFETAIADALDWLAGIQDPESPNTTLRLEPREEN